MIRAQPLEFDFGHLSWTLSLVNRKQGKSLEALPLLVYVIFTLLESLALIFVCTRKSDARSALRYQSILLHLGAARPSVTLIITHF